MKTRTVTEVSRSFDEVIDQLERDREEVLLTRNNQKIARLIPEPPTQTALEVFGDLYQTLDAPTGEALAASLEKLQSSDAGKLTRLKNPWAT